MALTTVKVTEGILEGLPGWDPRVSVFKGIPFAKPPVGDLRWKAPLPPEPWEGTKQAFWPGNIPVQPDAIPRMTTSMPDGKPYRPNIERSEDCLYLNIWTPAEATDEKLPVAVWVYGGAYIFGSPNELAYDGEAMARKGLIVVALSYRVNIFGFLSTKELSEESEKETGNYTSGNYGILDQIEAIKWVKKNISSFGGDPERISVFGQSAGSLSVQTLISTELTRGDIKAAIMQSGAGMGLPAIRRAIPIKEAERRGAEFLEYIGAKNIDEARKMDSEQVLDYWQKFVKTTFKLVYFSPVTDGYVLEESIVDIAKLNKHHNIPYMIGCTSDEHPFDPPLMDADYEAKKFDADFCFGKYAEKYLDMTNAKDHDKYWETVLSEPDLYDACIGWCEIQNELERQPSYMYYFNKKVPGFDKTYHAMDMPYHFKTIMRTYKHEYNGQDYDMAELMCSYWVNFLKTGDPNGEGLPEWTTFTKQSPMAMKLNENSAMYKPEPTELGRFQIDIAIGKLEK